MKTPNELWEEWFHENNCYGASTGDLTQKDCFLAGIRQGLMLASEKSDQLWGMGV